MLSTPIHAKVVLYGALTTAILASSLRGQASDAQKIQPSARLASSHRHVPGYILRDGSICIVTYSGMTGVVNALNALFMKSHPGVRFTVKEGDNYSGMASLTFDTTLLAPLGTKYTVIGLSDNLKIAPVPVGVRIAHASLSPTAQLSPLAIIVSRSNPLRILSMMQVERIFTTNPPTSDITHWSQLGITGELKDRMIVPYGPPGSDYYQFEDPQVGEYIALKMGGRNFNHSYRQMQNYRDVIARVADDSAAIGIAPINRLTPGVAVVGLEISPSSNALTGRREDIQSGRYPLDRYLYLYLRISKDARIDPLANAYVRMTLSSIGQQVIAKEVHGYIPLNSKEIAEELAKID